MHQTGKHNMKKNWLRFFSCLPTKKTSNDAKSSNLSSDLVAHKDANTTNLSSDLSSDLFAHKDANSSNLSSDLIPCNGANWSNLSSDLIALIAEHLTVDMADYVRFRAVCTAWRASTVDPRRRRHPPQLPWLIVNHSGNHVSFLSLSDGRKHRIKLPYGYNYMTFACDGWFVLEDLVRLRLALWNPVTCELVNLPTMSGLEGIKRLVSVDSFVMFRQGGQTSKRKIALYLVRGLALSSGDVSSCVVVVCFYSSMMLVRCHARDGSWTVIDNNNHYYNDVAFVGGVLYAVTGNGDVVVYSSTFKKVEHVRTPAITGSLSNCDKFQIVDLEGKVIVLCRMRGSTAVIDVEEHSPVYNTEKVHIFGLELQDNVLLLVKLNSLVRKMLFAGRCCRPIMVPIENYPLGKEDCVYFGDEYFCRTRDKLLCCAKSVVFSLEDETKSEFSYDRADTTVLGTSTWYSSRWHIPRFY